MVMQLIVLYSKLLYVIMNILSNGYWGMWNSDLDNYLWVICVKKILTPCIFLWGYWCMLEVVSELKVVALTLLGIFKQKWNRGMLLVSIKLGMSLTTAILIYVVDYFWHDMCDSCL